LENIIKNIVGSNPTMTQNQKPCLVNTAQGFSVSYQNKFLYSKYAPSKAILQTVSTLNLLPGTLILCLSPLLPYGLLELITKLPDNCILLGIEVDSNLREFINGYQIQNELVYTNTLENSITQNWQELNDIVVVSYGKVVVSYGKEKEESGTKDGMNPDTMPEFRDGDMSSFVNWITERINYPEGCTHTGNMKVGFLVDTDGKVKDVQILENVCEKLDEMVLSLVSSSPRWDKPAMSNGKPVPQFLTVPIEFQVR